MSLLFVVIAGVLWGLMSIFVKGLNEAGFSSIQIMMIRSLISSVLLGAFIFIKDRNLFKIKIKDIWMFLCTGIVSLAFFSVCYFSTIVECGASVAVVLLYTSPVFVLVLSAFFFREKITALKILALILTVAGCVLVAGLLGEADSRITVKGLLTGILSGLGYGLYSIFGTVALKKYKPLTVTFYTFVIAFLAMLPLSQPLKIISAYNFNSALLSAGVALFCTLLPFTLYTKGLQGLEPGKAAVVVTVEPLVGTLLGIFLWKETAGILRITGIFLIFAAIILCNIKIRQTESNN